MTDDKSKEDDDKVEKDHSKTFVKNRLRKELLEKNELPADHQAKVVKMKKRDEERER